MKNTKPIRHAQRKEKQQQRRAITTLSERKIRLYIGQDSYRPPPPKKKEVLVYFQTRIFPISKLARVQQKPITIDLSKDHSIATFKSVGSDRSQALQPPILSLFELGLTRMNEQVK